MTNNIIEKRTARGYVFPNESVLTTLSSKVAFLLLCLLISSVAYGQGVVKRQDTVSKSNSKNRVSKTPPRIRWAEKKYEYYDYIAVKDFKGKWGFIDKNGKLVIPCMWKDVYYFGDDELAPVQDDNEKWGCIDKTGTLVVPCRWKDLYRFGREGLAEVKGDNNKFGYIDKTGAEIIPCQWESVNITEKKQIEVRDGEGHYGLFDKTGKIITPCKWKKIYWYEGWACVTDENDKQGGIDMMGTEIIPCQFNIVRPTKDKRIIEVYDGEGHYGLFDKTGKVVTPCVWEYIGNFSEGLAYVKNQWKKYGFIDKTGKIVIPCSWETTWSFSEGLAYVKDKGGKYGYIDKTGKVVIPCSWKMTYGFSEGLATVEDANDQWGCIDKTGTIVIPCKWKGTGITFREGLLAVKNDNGKWGFIDKTNKTVILFKWKCAFSFEDGLAIVQDDNDKYGCIDKTGTLVIPCTYKKWGIWSKDGEGGSFLEDDKGETFYIKEGKLVKR